MPLLCRVLTVLLSMAACWPAQVGVTGSLSGTVTDQTAAVIAGAKVKITSESAGTLFETSTSASGVYAVAGLQAGLYRVEVSSAGFRTAVFHRVKVDVGQPAVQNIQLELGTSAESVQVEAQATTVITSTATVGTTITGRQITELPFTSRDALDLAALMAGFATGGSPRAGSFNALPKGAINITMDGVNTQDNLLKSSFGGGFFTYIRPRIDAIEEFSITTAAAGSEGAGEGAVQIKFVTKRGTNEWHGGVFWYHRNTALNANYWFNNVNGLPRQRLILNQWGGKLGGPIVKNKLFLFGVFDEFRLPESRLRQRTILSSEAVQGNFRYRGTDGQMRAVNVLDAARANGFPSTPDPLIRGILTQIDGLRTASGAGITPLDFFRDTLSFNNAASQIRRFPTGRLDWNISDKFQWEAIWNYNYFYSYPDTLNNRDRTYPGFETFNGLPTQGGQYSNRFSVTTALRWLASTRMSNELRLGVTGGTVSFAPEISPALFPNNLRVAFPFMTSPISLGLRSDRNTPVLQLSDNLGWQRNQHTLNFGFTFSRVTSFDRSYGNAIPTASLAVLAADPVAAVLTNGPSLPNISTVDEGNARALYALLTGRLSQVTGVVNVDEVTRKYVPGAPLTRRERQHEFGFYFTDSWRVRPSFTFNYGLRWEFQGAPIDTNNIYTSPGYDGLFGLSGPNNLFRPGTLTGQPTVYKVRQGAPWNNDWNNFAPSLGIAWSPKSENVLMKALFGSGGAFRAGYGISYTREGLQNYRSYAGNPGTTAQVQLIGDRDFRAGSLNLNSSLPGFRVFPPAYEFPLAQSLFTFSGTGPLWFDPNLRVPYVQSWSAGIQREVFPDTVLEVRYVGNKATNLWRGFNLNEVNIFENGFLDQFRMAKSNLDLCAANRVACTGTATGALRFDNRGIAGQRNLPLFEAAFSGLAAGTGFSNGTFLNQLNLGQAGGMANSLATSQTYMSRLTNAGYPRNFFQVNPEAAGANVWLLGSPSHSTYHSLQLELRRRLSRGFLVNGNYTFSKGLSDYYADSSDGSSVFITLRDLGLNKGLSPYDIRHQFKINWIYELPFGRGKMFSTGHPVLERLIGGWTFDGIARIQSGRPFRLSSGFTTVNQYDAGIVSTLDRGQLQSMVGVYKRPDRRVFFVDPKLVGPDGRSNPEFLRPASIPGEMGNFIYLYGPGFTRFDMSAIKKTRIREKWEAELRAEFLNAFNHVNFLVGGATASQVIESIQGTSFGQTTMGYQDISTTNDPGGRIVQIVLRINF